jgi:RNA processing factor Prp31
MSELHELIRDGASYSELVSWIQKRQRCKYIDACKQLNTELKNYRLLHQAPGVEQEIPSL